MPRSVIDFRIIAVGDTAPSTPVKIPISAIVASYPNRIDRALQRSRPTNLDHAISAGTLSEVDHRLIPILRFPVVDRMVCAKCFHPLQLVVAWTR